MLGPRERMPQHPYTGLSSTYDEAHPLLQASHHHRWQTLPKSRSRQSTQRLSPNQEGSRQSTEYYAVDHLDISKIETSLRRPQRTTLSQLRSGHCHLLNSYKHSIGQEDDPQCKDCGYDNQDVNHLLDCPAHPTVMSPTKLWSMPADTIGEFAYLDPE